MGHLVIPDTQCLPRVGGAAPHNYWMHLLLIHVRDGMWITVDPDLAVVMEDLSEDEVIPFPRAMGYPVEGFPLRVFEDLTDVQIALPLFRATINYWLATANVKTSGSSVGLGAALPIGSAGSGTASSSVGAGSPLGPGVHVDSSACDESPSNVALSLAATRINLEPLGFLGPFLESHGLDTRSTVSFSLRYDFFMLDMLGVHDRNDMFDSSAAEDLWSRIRQQMRAVRTNPKNPDLECVSACMRQADVAFGIVATPTFDKYIAETQKTEAQFWKEDKLRREEIAAHSQRRNMKNGKGDPKGTAAE